MDNRDSHISIESLNYAKENGIILLTIPPHTSHNLQPLDCTVYGPLKRYFNVAAQDWMTNHPAERITIYQIAELIGIAYPKAMVPNNIINGFKITGMYPLNRNIFSED
ncbi:hypothetical protein AVEN_20123-1 [Araneus ventricosus]|uniref:DDE-1 domain-containing protein n=1 Tax=Araneus ventricosus TaxID=182803 RepID=A0A4Y2H459_ARAVE|nr:hypothetical protein AVEN_20123-1 [Araneus ventricosus]